MSKLREFLEESNHIEGIPGVREEEVRAAQDFLHLYAVGVDDLVNLVRVIEPRAELRDRIGLDVRVGNHRPPRGGPRIREHLADLLLFVEREGPHKTHARYEWLHPFTDGNGRSGRLLWLWQMWKIVPRVPPLLFLHTWYYQSLDAYGEPEEW